jgi:hypothetical protein
MAIDQERPVGRRDDKHTGELWRNPLVHFVACFAIGVLVALAIFAIHWLA